MPAMQPRLDIKRHSSFGYVSLALSRLWSLWRLQFPDDRFTVARRRIDLFA